MQTDVVMLALLMGWAQNATVHEAWPDVLACPKLQPSRGEFAVIPQLTEQGLPTGDPMLLSRAQLAFKVFAACGGLPRLLCAW